jgi:mRNA interferase MazF
MDMVNARRFEVWLIALNPTRGAEINKNRPCMVVSPDEANHFLSTVIIVPLTSSFRDYPTRVNCRFQNKAGQLAIDQIRAVDKKRLIKKMGVMEDEIAIESCLVLTETFKY